MWGMYPSVWSPLYMD